MGLKHETLPDGRSATTGDGLSIEWFDLASGKGGATVEDAIEAAVYRLDAFQAGILPCAENDRAIFHLRQALECLERRTTDRERRGVEGEMVP